MKSIYLFFVLLAAGVSTVSAQEGLAINDLFDGRFHNDRQASENIITGSWSLAAYKLSVYHGLTLSCGSQHMEDLERAVMADGSHAIRREVNYRDGHLYYGFYTLTQRNRNNRYIFYINRCITGGDQAILIYLEGKASPEQVKSMLKK